MSDSSIEIRPISQDRLPDIGGSISAQNRKSREKNGLTINTRPERSLIPISSEKIFTKYTRDRERGEMTPLNDNFLGSIDYAKTQKQSMSKEISSGISYLDMANRIRDLEKKFIDLSSNMDRRIQAFIEENPQKILRNLKILEEKDSILWRENHYKQSSMEENIAHHKDQLRDNLENLSQALVVMNRRIDNSEYKVQTLERGIDGFNKIKVNNLIPLDNKPANGSASEKLETEVRLLREALNQERQKREVFFGDLMKQYQEVFSFVHKNESEILTKLQKHKDDIHEQTRLTKEQQRKLEEIKLEKLLGDNEYLRNIYKQLENRIEEEVNRRLHHEFENKQWMEHKIGIFRDEIRSDEKDLLEGEKRFAEQMHDSIASLNQIIKNTKEQLEANIAATQTIFNENVKNLTQTMSVMKENVYSKLNVMDTVQRDLGHKVQETNANFHQHTQSVNEALDREFQRIEKVTLKFEEVMNEKIEIQNQKLQQMDQKGEQWRKEFEDKNLKVLLEMGNALKSLKNDINKEKKDTLERFERTKEELQHLRTSNEKLKNQMDEHMKIISTQFDAKLNEAVVKLTERMKETVTQLQEEIAQMGRSVYEKSTKDLKLGLLNLDKKLTNYTNEEIKKVAGEINQRITIIKEQLETEIRTNYEELQSTIARVEAEKTRDIQDIRRDILDLRKENESIRIEFRERIKDVAAKFESKLKVNSDNLKVYVSERLSELRKDIDQMFEQHTEKFLDEINIARERNQRLVSQLYDRIKEEARKEMQAIEDRILAELDEERRIRAEKDTEQVNMLQSTKLMLMETIKTRIESTQALARALVNEEAAERAKADEQLLRTLQQQIKSVEEALRNLIHTSIEELRIEFDNKLRQLEIKFEQLQLWVIRELNKIIDDFEDYVRYATSQFHVLELELRTESQLTLENFQKVDIELVRIDNQRDKDMEHVKNEFDRVEKQRKDDLDMIENKLNDIKEENKKELERIDAKIAENETKMNNKFDEVAAQREQDMNRIDDQFKDVEEKRQQDVQRMDAEIEERKKKNAEYEEIMSEHQKQISETKEALDNAVKLIKDDIANNIKELEDTMIAIDEKFTNAVDDINIKMQVKDYLDNLYRKAKQEEDNANLADNKKRFQKYDEQFRAVADRFEETDKALENFEDKTESNFKIAEEMLLSHSNYIFAIDGRLTAEELFSRVTLSTLEERVALEFAQLEGQVNLMPEELQGKFEKRVGDLQRMIEEDIIPSTVLKMTEALGNVKNEIGNENAETKNFLAQRLSEHEKTLISHTELLNSHDQRIVFAEENFDSISEILQKYNKRLSDDEQELDKAKEELIVQIEAKFQAVAATEKAVERNLVRAVQDVIGDLENILFASEKSGVKAGHLQEIKNTLLPEFREYIKFDTPSIIEKQATDIANRQIQQEVPSMIKNDVSNITDTIVPQMLDQKIGTALKDDVSKIVDTRVTELIQQEVPQMIDAKQQETLGIIAQQQKQNQEQQQQQQQQDNAPKVDKTELDNLHEKVKHIEHESTKHNDELRAKITDLEQKLRDMDQKLGTKGGSGDGGQINEEVKEELRKFKQLIDEIQKEQREKERQNNEMNKKLDNMSDNMRNMENAIKGQIDKSSTQQDENQKVITNQLDRLFNQFQTLQDKLYVDQKAT